MIEIELQGIKCGQCRLIYLAVEHLHCECPICGFPSRNFLPQDCFPGLWTQRPEG